MDALEKVYMKRIFVEKKSEQHKKEMSRRENPNLCKDLPVSDDGPPSKSHKMVKTFLDTCLLASLLNWRRKEPDQAKPTRSIVCALGWIYISLHHDQSFIHPKYSKYWPYTVAHTIDCVCSKMLNHGLLLSHFKHIPCHIHWIVFVLAYLNFIFEF